MKLYQTSATAVGGRSGVAYSDDGRLEVGLSVPGRLGGDDGPGTNPEQLFAAGYAACFDSALRLVARRQKIEIGEGSRMTADVSLARTESGLFQLGVVLTGTFPTLDRSAAESLMEAAHKVCPYSAATRGNISVELRVRDNDAAESTENAA
jgi:lipoyl-dependent peroxiredoxin